jgi:hypothetical protein
VERARTDLAAVWIAVVALLVASLTVAVGRSRARAAETAPAPVGAGHRAGFSPGAGIFNESDSDLAKDLDLMASTGAKWVRFDFPWASVEPTPPSLLDGVLTSTFDWRRVDRLVDAAHARGLQVIALPFHTPAWARPLGTDDKHPPTDPAVFATFLEAAVRRYGPKGVKVWEVWNEPNLSVFWSPKPDPGAYTALLTASAAGIRRADPGATVLLGGLSPATDAPDGSQISPVTFLEGVYAAGGRGAFDAVGMHPYSYPARPTDPETASWNTFYRLPLVHDVMVDNGDGSKKIWATEFGAPTGTSSQAVSTSEQAAMVEDGYEGIAQWEWTGPMLWYSHRDSGTDPADREQNFGLVKADFTAKPALDTFKSVMGGGNSSPPAPTVPGAGTYEDDSPAVAYTGSWNTATSSYDSGGSMRHSLAVGAAVELRFAGTAVQWLARRQANAGFADVFLDGAKVATVDLYSAGTQFKQTVFDKTGLVSGEHTIRVVRTGTKNASSSATLVDLDAFVVSDLPPAPGPGTYEDTSSSLAYTGSWNTATSSYDSGGSMRHSLAVGAAVELRFAGTAVQWLARRQANAGMSDVYIDGAKVATVDLYAPSTRFKQVVFEKAALGPGEHTIRVVRTGTKNALSSATLHDLDAFVVSDPPVPGPGTYEDDNPAVAYIGAWNTATSAYDSGGSMSHSLAVGAAAELRFAGTAVTWLARRQANAGMSDVYIDGAKVATVDLYAATTQFKRVVFEKTDLPPGEHTIRVVRTGTKNTLSLATLHDLDAFVVPQP